MKEDNSSYDPRFDYCTMSPDVVLGVVINYGCYIHDRHYRNERKVRLTRKEADQLMRDIIYAKLIESDATFVLKLSNKKLKIHWEIFRSDLAFWKWVRRKLAYSVSGVYYLAVRWFACRNWVKE